MADCAAVPLWGGADREGIQPCSTPAATSSCWTRPTATRRWSSTRSPRPRRPPEVNIIAGNIATAGAARPSSTQAQTASSGYWSRLDHHRVVQGLRRS